MYDVMVVGAGPAGSTCARECARQGLRTLLLDKARFPRSKPWGGALSAQALPYLDFELPREVVEKECFGVRIHFEDDVIEVKDTGRLVVLISRDRFMWHHVRVGGINAESLGGVFKDISMAEMKHAEAIAERLDYIGGAPSTMPLKRAICLAKTPKEMLEIDKKEEEEAISLYRSIIKLAEKEDDYTTKRLFEEILSAEEDHHNIFMTLLEK